MTFTQVGGTLIDAGKTVLMLPADMVFVVKLLAGCVVIMAMSGLLRAVAHVVQAWRSGR
jgi:hypothetical protein